MTSFKKTSFMLMIALGLLGAACGDDDKDDKKDPTGEDAGSNNGGDDTDAGDNGGNSGGECVGGYAGFTEQQITDNIQDEKGACASEADINGVCTLSPSDKAREVGLPCFLSVSGNKDLTEEQKAQMTGDCALNGKGTQEGLKTMLKTMSEDCISCYVAAVVCAAQNCAGPCGAGTPAECDTCRDEKGCTSDFYTCSGLPTDKEIEAAK